MKYLFALDSGTTSTRATLFDLAGHKIYTAQRDLECTYPFPGYVHQDPTAIFVSAVDVINEVLIRTGVSGKDIIGLGIATQRETCLLFDSNTGKPLTEAIVWQSNETNDVVKKYLEYKDLIHKKDENNKLFVKNQNKEMKKNDKEVSLEELEKKVKELREKEGIGYEHRIIQCS